MQDASFEQSGIYNLLKNLPPLPVDLKTHAGNLTGKDFAKKEIVNGINWSNQENAAKALAHSHWEYWYPDYKHPDQLGSPDQIQEQFEKFCEIDDPENPD